jgi:signal transduction histidine kinase
MGNSYLRAIALLLYWSLPRVVFGQSATSTKWMETMVWFLAAALTAALIAVGVLLRRRPNIEPRDSLPVAAVGVPLDTTTLMHITAHDLREPVRTMGAFASLLKRRIETCDNPSPDALEYADYIVGGAKKLEATLNDIETFVALDSQNQAPKSLLPLQTLLDDIASDKAALLAERGIRLTTTPALPTVQAHAHQMNMLLRHLLDNAVKFASLENPSIHVGYRITPTEHLLWVEDNGIGVDKAYHTQIFTPFARLDKQHYEGTGMGLAICQRIVQLHGGQIWIHSEPGQGSRFYFTLPRETNPPSPNADAKPRSIIHTELQNRQAVLV